MSLLEELNASVGKNINKICGNGFHDATLNHCAHFVSHMLGLTFSYNCRQHVGGTKTPGNLRVNEIFRQCPKVGEWSQADKDRTQIIFVTRDSHVDVSTRTMTNHPQKHVGVYCNGTVYHYGNSNDKVTTDTPASFLTKFQAAYDGNQKLYFGWIPGENLNLAVKQDGRQASAVRQFDLPDPDGELWRAKALGENQFFVVGRNVNQPARKFHGIRNDIPENLSPIFRPADYVDVLDQWAVLLGVTGACESNNRMNLVNTYDRGKFTFGFYQLAAHTPRANLILLFHRLARLPGFSDYFPELELRDGRLTRRDADGSSTNLEQEFVAANGEKQIMLFMNYLNPNRFSIERQEVLQAARLMHWTATDPAMRRAQVDVSAAILQQRFESHAKKLPLDGRSDTVCAIVADIHHQGRAKYHEVRPLLAAGASEEDLIRIGEAKDRDRIGRLRAQIKGAKAAGALGRHRYNQAGNIFVPG